MLVITNDERAQIRALSIDELKQGIKDMLLELEDLRDQDQVAPTYARGIMIEQISVWIDIFKSELSLKSQVKLASTMVPFKSMEPAAGGSMPLSYLNPNYRESSASSGSNVLVSEVGLARPVLNLTGGKRSSRHSNKRSHKHTRRCMCRKRHGGFSPSIMGNFVGNASRLVPAAAVTGYRMVKNYNKTRKNKSKK